MGDSSFFAHPLPAKIIFLCKTHRSRFIPLTTGAERGVQGVLPPRHHPTSQPLKFYFQFFYLLLTSLAGSRYWSLISIGKSHRFWRAWTSSNYPKSKIEVRTRYTVYRVHGCVLAHVEGMLINKFKNHPLLLLIYLL